MLMRLSQVRDLIRETIAGEGGYYDPAVLDLLSNVPPRFILMGRQIDVDPDELKKNIADLVEYAAAQGIGVHANTVLAAMQSGICHYLWLC